jgi:cobalt-zinc-cadmium efflux system membrane fusion protein
MATEPRPKRRHEPIRNAASALDDTLEAGVRKHGLSEYSKMKQDLKGVNQPNFLVRAALGMVVLVAVVGAGYLAVLKVQTWTKKIPVEVPPGTIQLVEGKSGAMRISKEVVKSLGGVTASVVVAPSPESLKLSGSLFVNPNRMVRVHARFAGEVIAIGVYDPTNYQDPNAQIIATPRPLQFGDTVKEDKLLAVIWSKEVGEKKSELVDALSQLELDRLTVDRLKELYKTGSVSERSLREAERNFESDQILVAKLERTLLSWRLNEEDLEVVRAEAERIHAGNQKPDKTLEKTWAEVDVRAPFSGVILEKNITKGDIVSTDLDLFKIADLSRLGVMAYVYEEDVALLENLPRDKRHWMIKLKAMPDAPGIRGDFEMIGKVVDPTQHTAVVIGWVDNKNEALRVGQFITASIDLPANPDEVAIPDLALIEEGTSNTVFTATESASGELEITRRNIAVVRRTRRVVYVRSIPTSEEARAGALPLHVGELVVAGGTIELASQMQELEASAKIAKK